MLAGESLHERLERPLCEIVKMKPGCSGDAKMLEMSELWISAKESCSQGMGADQEDVVRIHDLPKNDTPDSNSVQKQRSFYSAEVQHVGVYHLPRWR